jgi:hypothetical protein
MTKPYTPPETGVTATVQLTLEIKVGDSWGGDCAMDQVYKQARDSAVGMINEALRAGKPALQTRIKIVGTPSISAVVVERKT